jgi:hypothetical protein
MFFLRRQGEVGIAILRGSGAYDRPFWSRKGEAFPPSMSTPVSLAGAGLSAGGGRVIDRFAGRLLVRTVSHPAALRRIA